MSIQEIDRYQRGLIITDDNAFEPILDFNLYRDAIVNIINNSYPKFTIGIFGDWGTGKTTLMNSINDELELKYKENVHTVWFDAWKYENEKEFALIPLLKTINYSIKDDKNEKKKKLKEALKEAAIFTLGVSSDIISSVITNYAGRHVGTLFKRSLDDATTKLIPKLKELNSLSEIDRNTIFYDGIENIQKAINELQTPDNPFRFVIFIDDLDRCSEDKILEILESIKIFLSLKGIIYVLGISHDRIIELINKKFQTNNGEQYIKKIIQIPITLPKWINQDIVDFITNLKKKGIINHKYQEVFNQENIELISEAIENNPREIKRFLNNFIVASEIFSSKQVVAKELLVIQAIQLRWNKFYDLLMKSNENFRKELNRYIEMNEEKRLKYLESDETKKDDRENYDLRVRRSLREFKTNTYLWEFLIKNSSTINNIENWNIYRRATEVSKEPILHHSDIKNYPRIFVSYSTRDADEFANHIKRYLSTFNYDVFTGVDRISLGESWNHDIEHNISNCDIFVVIVTYGALSSLHVEEEVLQAQRERKTIIPCFHRGVSNIKWGLNQIPGVEFDDKNELARDLYSKIDISKRRFESLKM